MNLHRRLVTLADVARESGFGESTVSRVLRNQGSFSKRTADRVAEAVAKLGYVPNRLAGSLAGNAASAGSQLVGIVIPSLANIVFPDLLRGLTGALDRTGFQSVIGVSDYDPDREEALVAALLSWRPAGLVLTGLEHNPDTVALLRAAGIRVVEMIDTDGPGLDLVVGFSNRAVGEASAAHLVARGYRRIGYVGHDIFRDLR
ncbi:MAG: LacI family DNA-binding transcriptional regulator, partial [Methylobacterium sp.]